MNGGWSARGLWRLGSLLYLAASFAGCDLFGGAPRPDVIAEPSFLEQYAATYRFRLGQPTNIQVSRDGDTVLFLRSGPRTFVRDLYALDVKTGSEKVLLTAEQILAGGE